MSNPYPYSVVSCNCPADQWQRNPDWIDWPDSDVEGKSIDCCTLDWPSSLCVRLVSGTGSFSGMEEPTVPPSPPSPPGPMPPPPPAGPPSPPPPLVSIFPEEVTAVYNAELDFPGWEVTYVSDQGSLFIDGVFRCCSQAATEGLFFFGTIRGLNSGEEEQYPCGCRYKLPTDDPCPSDISTAQSISSYSEEDVTEALSISTACGTLTLEITEDCTPLPPPPPVGPPPPPPPPPGPFWCVFVYGPYATESLCELTHDISDYVGVQCVQSNIDIGAEYPSGVCLELNPDEWFWLVAKDVTGYTLEASCLVCAESPPSPPPPPPPADPFWCVDEYVFAADPVCTGGAGSGTYVGRTCVQSSVDPDGACVSVGGGNYGFYVHVSGPHTDVGDCTAVCVSPPPPPLIPPPPPPVGPPPPPMVTYYCVTTTAGGGPYELFETVTGSQWQDLADNILTKTGSNWEMSFNGLARYTISGWDGVGSEIFVRDVMFNDYGTVTVTEGLCP